jgi:hypothetical protein
MMSMDEFRAEMDSYRKDAKTRADALKDPFIVPEQLAQLYGKFDAAERAMADQVFCEWAVSDDRNLRFLATNMIEDLMIRQAVPSLRDLARRLASVGTPMARGELKMIDRLIGILTA